MPTLFEGRTTGNVETVELSLVTELSAKLEMYEAERLDTLDLWFLSPAEMDRVRHQYAGEYISGPWLVTAYVGFDTSRSPFDDPRVRRAFALATDRGTLADVVMRGYVFPATAGPERRTGKRRSLPPVHQQEETKG